MAFTSGFFDAELIGGAYDRVYSAEAFAEYFSTFIANGVFPTPATNLQVSANAVNDMNVLVGAGMGWINGYWCKNSGPYPIAIQAASGTLNRIDIIVFGWNKTTRTISSYVKTGTASASPTAPDLVRNADLYELMLASVTVTAGATKITQANITDKRADKAICGWVSGVVDQIDATNLFAQYDAAFKTWFKDIQDQLSGDVATNLQNQINALKTDKLAVASKATKAEAEAGVDDTKWMTSLSSKQSIIANGGLVKNQYGELGTIVQTPSMDTLQQDNPSKVGELSSDRQLYVISRGVIVTLVSAGSYVYYYAASLTTGLNLSAPNSRVGNGQIAYTSLYGSISLLPNGDVMAVSPTGHVVLDGDTGVEKYRKDYSSIPQPWEGLWSSYEPMVVPIDEHSYLICSVKANARPYKETISLVVDGSVRTPRIEYEVAEYSGDRFSTRAWYKLDTKNHWVYMIYTDSSMRRCIGKFLYGTINDSFGVSIQGTTTSIDYIQKEHAPRFQIFCDGDYLYVSQVASQNRTSEMKMYKISLLTMQIVGTSQTLGYTKSGYEYIGWEDAEYVYVIGNVQSGDSAPKLNKVRKADLVIVEVTTSFCGIPLSNFTYTPAVLISNGSGEVYTAKSVCDSKGLLASNSMVLRLSDQKSFYTSGLNYLVGNLGLRKDSTSVLIWKLSYKTIKAFDSGIENLPWNRGTV